MVRDDHQLGTQVRGVPAQQAALDDVANIARQQCARIRGFDPQYAAGLVAQVRKTRAGMQEAKAHPVPLPLLPGAAACGDVQRRTRWRSRACHRQPRAHCGIATSMIGIGMAEHDGVQPAHTKRAQRRQHDALAGIEAVAHRRTGIEQQRMALRAHQHRQALTHIQHLHFRLACGR